MNHDSNHCFRQKEIALSSLEEIVAEPHVVRVVNVLVFLTIKVESGQVQEVHTLLREHPEVVESHHVVEGPFDIVALVSVEAFDSYREFAVDKMGALPHIVDYTSFIAIAE